MVSTSVVRMKIPNDVLGIISDFAVFSNEEKFIRERFYLIIHGDLTKDDFGNASLSGIFVQINDHIQDFKIHRCWESYNIRTDKTHKVHSKDHRYITDIAVCRIKNGCLDSREVHSEVINKNFEKFKNTSEYIEHICELMLGLFEEFDFSFENFFVEGKRRQAYRTFLSHQKIVDTLDKCISRNR